jgi:hypothetical protein
MNTTNPKLETCRQLISELRWTERHAVQSARIAISKALWLGIDMDEVMQLIRTVPSATFVRQCPHILTQTWEAIAQANEPGQQLDDIDRLLNALN